MITIVKNQENRLTFQVDESLVDCNKQVDLKFYSPSRPALSFSGFLRKVGGGFFTFTISLEQSQEFIDDTYSYYLQQDGFNIAHGRARLRVLFVETSLGFDYSMNFSLS